MSSKPPAQTPDKDLSPVFSLFRSARFAGRARIGKIRQIFDPLYAKFQSQFEKREGERDV